MKAGLLKAISEVHSGTKKEGRQIVKAVLAYYEPIIQDLGDMSDTCTYSYTGKVCIGCRCPKYDI